MQGHTEETKQNQPHPLHPSNPAMVCISLQKAAIEGDCGVPGLFWLVLHYTLVNASPNKLLRCHLHEVRPEAMDDCTQSKATFPGGGQVSDINVSVSLCLLLAPRQKLVRPNIWLCRNRRTNISATFCMPRRPQMLSHSKQEMSLTLSCEIHWSSNRAHSCKRTLL